MSAPVVREGWLRKRGGRGTFWSGERYFVLKGNTLTYYVKFGDTEPKGQYTLQQGCKVSEIKTETSKKKKQFYVFKLTFPATSSSGTSEHEEAEEKERESLLSPDAESSPSFSQAPPPSPQLSRRKLYLGSKTKKQDDAPANHKSNWSAAKIGAVAVGAIAVGALTAGMGLVIGMVVLGIGVAGGGGAVAFTSLHKHKDESVMLASDIFADAEEWVSVIEQQIRRCDLYAGASMAQPIRPPPSDTHLQEVDNWTRRAQWRLCDVRHGVRIFQQWGGVAVKDASVPICRKIQVSVHSPPESAFRVLMSPPTHGVVRMVQPIEHMDDHSDTVYMSLAPCYLWPTWIAPRDFVLTRYWRQDEDGSYIICLDSTSDSKFPVVTGKVRGDFHGVYLITPPRDVEHEEDLRECMITCIVQLDPRGWVYVPGYVEELLVQYLLHLLDVRDALDAERFVQVQVDAHEEISDVTPGAAAGGGGGIEAIPPPALHTSVWGEPDSTSFRVRGPDYLTDKVKVPSAQSIMRLLAVDLFEVHEPTRNIASHPQNRVTLAKLRGDKSFVFITQIMVPGPPHYAFVVYFTPRDPHEFEKDTPFYRIAHEFFFGESDHYRNLRFKLIPKIVDGNVVVRMTVKDTPAIMGTKLKQYYFRGENYFELDIDVGSSSVAHGVVRVALGYSKSIVVDMGFVFEGKKEDELPEVLIGCVRCDHVDMGTAKHLPPMLG